MTIRSRLALEAAVLEGMLPEYLFFWGHTPAEDGGVTKACLSQWWESPFEIDGIVYRTAEHFLMASKARLFGDDDALEKILAAVHPKKAKDLGHGVQGFDEAAWSAKRFELVAAGNEAKFLQNAELAKYLMTTGNRVLVEASPVDRIWGIGLAEDDPRAGNPAEWCGQNLLGFALMEVRDRLRGEAPQIPVDLC